MKLIFYVLVFVQSVYVEAYINWLIDTTMQGPQLTPDRINKLVAERSAYRAALDYENADKIKFMLEKEGVTITDYPYRQKRESSWTWSAINLNAQNSLENDPFNILSLAHNISMERLMFNSAVDSPVIDMIRNRLLTSNMTIPIIRGDGQFVSEDTVSINVDSSMQGRKYADAAFEFAFCGIKDKPLFELLSDRAEGELIRFGERISCRPVNILQIVEKLAVAGVTNHSIYQTAYSILNAKRKSRPDNMESGKLSCSEEILDIDEGEEDSLSITAGTFSNLALGDFSLFSNRPLLMLWRFAAKQKKAGLQIEASQQEENVVARAAIAHKAFKDIFADPSLPLVIDIGCGYGVYLLRLCDLAMRNHSILQGKYRQLNYLGVDMNRRCVLYANGLSSRWGMEQQCAFLEMDSLTCLDYVLNNYPGSVSTILINFPTPYNLALLLNEEPEEMVAAKEEGSLDDDTTEENHRESKPGATGNAQLPERLDYFMCNKELVCKIKEIFRSKRNLDASIPQLMYVQSNVEDVAVTMRDVILKRETLTQPSSSGDTDDSSHQIDSSAHDGFHLPSSAEDAEMYVADVLFNSITRGKRECAMSDSGAAIDWVRREESDSNRAKYSLRDQKWAELLLSQPPPSIPHHSSNIPVHGRRAFGRGWLSRSPFPQTKTETEAYCEQMGKRVHRILFKFGNTEDSTLGKLE